MLTREELLRKTVRTRLIHLSAGPARVRELTGVERVDYLKEVNQEGVLEIAPDLQMRLASWCVIDDDGARVFRDDDVEAIGDMGGADLEIICLAILGVSGLTDEGFDDLKKFSEPVSGAPGSDLPKLSGVQ